MQSELKHRFRKYTDPEDGDYKPLLIVATFLDPRYKLLLNPTQTASAKSELLKQLKELSDNGENSSSSTSASPAHQESDKPPMKKFCHLSRLMEQKWKEDKRKASRKRPGEQEL